MTRGQRVVFADEMNLGLTGRVRRVWGPRGFKVRQRLDGGPGKVYLALAINGVTGSLHWRWLEGIGKQDLAATVLEWGEAGVRAIVWDNVNTHQCDLVWLAAKSAGVELLSQPKASPELNPAERLIEWLRQHVEGQVYRQLYRKKLRVEALLTGLAADPDRICQLAGWSWIRQAVGMLPAQYAA